MFYSSTIWDRIHENLIFIWKSYQETAKDLYHIFGASKDQQAFEMNTVLTVF